MMLRHYDEMVHQNKKGQEFFSPEMCVLARTAAVSAHSLRFSQQHASTSWWSAEISTKKSSSSSMSFLSE